MKNYSNIPLKIFIGPYDIVYKDIINLLKQVYCNSQNKFNDIECLKIESKQHESIIFIEPKNSYSINDLSIIFEKITFKLNDNEKVFFVLNNAEKLTTITSNKLLKILEEPPVGYYFILQYNNEHEILDTIKSRGEIFRYRNDITSEHYPFLKKYFFDTKTTDPYSFIEELKKENLDDAKSLTYINILLNKYIRLLSQMAPDHNKADIIKIIDLLKESVENPPRSGSSKIFWKHLYLQFNFILNSHNNIK